MLRLGVGMVIDTPFFHCFFCGRRFEADPLMQEGCFIQAWKVASCARCVSGNGVAADHPAIKKLAQKGIVVAGPKNGFLAWPDDVRPRATNTG
jgi:hypothetical protein